MAKNLCIKPSELTISLLGAAVASYGVKADLNSVLKQIKSDRTFINSELQDVRHNISIRLINNRIVVKVKTPVASDLIKKFSVNKKISITNLKKIISLKEEDLNTKNLDSNIKTLTERAKKIKIEVLNE